MKIPAEGVVPEGANTFCGSGGFRCRYLVRFRKFPVQVEGYGADIWLNSVLERALVQLPDEVPEGLQVKKVPEGSGADTL